MCSPALKACRRRPLSSCALTQWRRSRPRRAAPPHTNTLLSGISHDAWPGLLLAYESASRKVRRLRMGKGHRRHGQRFRKVDRSSRGAFPLWRPLSGSQNLASGRRRDGACSSRMAPWSTPRSARATKRRPQGQRQVHETIRPEKPRSKRVAEMSDLNLDESRDHFAKIRNAPPTYVERPFQGRGPGTLRAQSPSRPGRVALLGPPQLFMCKQLDPIYGYSLRRRTGPATSGFGVMSRQSSRRLPSSRNVAFKLAFLTILSCARLTFDPDRCLNIPANRLKSESGTKAGDEFVPGGLA